MHDHILKFKVLNHVLVLKEQDFDIYESSSEKLKFWIRLWRSQTLKVMNIWKTGDSKGIQTLNHMSLSEGSDW